jgi:LAO/AO transport system kinase
VVVLVPGMGDDVQTMKAGIMEIGDVLVINKADRDGSCVLKKS